MSWRQAVVWAGAAAFAASVSAVLAGDAPVDLPTGQRITPTAMPGAVFQPLAIDDAGSYVADGASAIAVSPDKRTMLVLTSGFNVVNGADGKRLPDQSQQYVFVYDIGGGAATRRQVLTVANTFGGIVWRADGARFYVSGGVDDVVYEFARTKGGFAPRGKPIALGHKEGLGNEVKPQAAGLAINPRGDRLLVANYYNDSVSLIDLRRRKVIAERDLRPGKNDSSQKGVAGGQFPLSIAWDGGKRAYVSAPRDREIVALSVSRRTVTVAKRIATIGEPTALLLNRKRARLYATEDNDDRLAVIGTSRDVLVSEERLTLPRAMAAERVGKGLNPNALALSADMPALFVTFGGINAVGLVDLAEGTPQVVGLVPTGWYPSAIGLGADNHVFIGNRKGPPGANPKACGPNFAADRKAPRACSGANQYIYQLEKAGLLSFAFPAPEALAQATLGVGANIGLAVQDQRAKANAVMAGVRAKIKHVVFIIKENRTYDQVLGDLEIGNGDPHLAILGEALTPNHHDLARKFVTFDNFYDSGEQSSTGWNWSTAARATDLMEKTAPVNYAGRGLAYESEGSIRDVNVAVPRAEQKKWHAKTPDDDDLLPGERHLTAPDGDGDDMEGQGYLWDAAIRAGLSVRNYGFASDFVYDPDEPNSIPVSREPAKEKLTVFVPSNKALASRSDPYFRGYDQKLPDYWRVQEWMRDFDELAASNNVPALSLVRISHDHFGDFDKAIDGVNTVETQMADNDYALGLIVEKIAHSPVADSTLVFVIEDDAQGGADHVDARRSVAYIVGPYVKQRALVSTRYTTVSLLRTIEDVLGIPPLGLNDGLALPMSDTFDLDEDDWSYKARIAKVLHTTQLPLPREDTDALPGTICPMRTAAYWAKAMRGQYFGLEDRLDTGAFNAALWAGLKGEQAASPTRHGRDLRDGRAALLGEARNCAQR